MILSYTCEFSEEFLRVAANGWAIRLHRAGKFGIRWLKLSQIPNTRKGIRRSPIGNRCFSASWWFLIAAHQGNNASLVWEINQPRRNWDNVRAPTGGSSEESWAMNASLTQWELLHDECAQFSVKWFREMRTMTLTRDEAPTNFVPAVAVRRRARVLFVLIGCKG